MLSRAGSSRPAKSAANLRLSVRLVRIALLTFLFLLTYDGALRKWALPAAEQVIFILKDALLLAVFAQVVLTGLHRHAPIAVPPVVKLAFGLYSVWVAQEALNPWLPNILVGLWGLKAHLLYASLFVLVPIAFGDLRSALGTLEKIYPFLVVPVCSLAFLQVALPADHFINQQVRGGMEGIAYFGDANLVRVAGPFSYITGMATFVQFSALLGAGLYIAGARSLLFLCGLAFAVAALPVTGSRAVVLAVASGTVVVFFFGVLARVVSISVLLRALFAVGVLLAVSLAAQDTAWEAFQQRAEANRDEGTPRILTAFTNAFDFFGVAGALGYGAGSANFGSPALAPGEAPFSWLPPGIGFEEESGRLVLELGYVGWGLSLAMRVAFLLWAVSLTINGATSASRVTAAMTTPFMAMGVHQGNGIFAPPFGAMGYWFFASLLAMAERESRCARRL
jgi:hypothetical protein